jgi:hypothetical protein
LVVGLLAAALNAVGGGVAHAAQVSNPVAAAAPGDVVTIRNIGSNHCAEPIGFGNGDIVVQRTCDPSNNNQKWVLSHIGGGVYQFVNVGTSKCLDVKNGQNADRTPIQQWACTGTTSMRWKGNPNFDGVALVVSETGGRCLDVFGSEGAPLRLIHCTGFGNLAQVWTFPQA